MISCSDAVRQLWEYLENDLDPGDRESIEHHLAFCRRCCGEVEFAEELQRFLRTAARPHLPRDVEARLTGFLEALEQEAP